MLGPFDSEPLREDHDLASFDCGKPELDSWLREYALHAIAMRTARVFVWTDDLRVVAYYTLNGHQVNRDDVPPRIGRGGPAVLPAVLVGKLALDQSLRGHGLGGDLVVDAFERILTATSIVAARVVVVDAIDEEAVSFWEHFGFIRTAPDSPRLIQKLSSIEKALSDAQ